MASVGTSTPSTEAKRGQRALIVMQWTICVTRSTSALREGGTRAAATAGVVAFVASAYKPLASVVAAAAMLAVSTFDASSNCEWK